MARVRLINPEFFLHEGIAACSPHARLLFIALWTQADRLGRIRWLPVRILGEAFPHEPAVKVNDLAAELEKAGALRLYSVGDRLFGYLPGFCRWQKPHRNEAESRIPDPPEEVGTTKGQPRAVGKSAQGGTIRNTEYGIRNTEVAIEDPLRDPLRQPPKGKKVSKEELTPSGDEGIDGVASLIVASWGPKSARGRSPRPPKIGRPSELPGWVRIQREAYPGIDLLEQTRLALAWEASNPEKKKVQIRSFLGRWFARAQDKGGSRRSVSATDLSTVVEKARNLGASI